MERLFAEGEILNQVQDDGECFRVARVRDYSVIPTLPEGSWTFKLSRTVNGKLQWVVGR